MKGTSPSPARPVADTGDKCHDGKCSALIINSLEKGKSMTILYAGIDLAKNVFALHGVNAAGAVVLRQPKVGRARLHELVATLPACTIGIEACECAHTGPDSLLRTATPSS